MTTVLQRLLGYLPGVYDTRPDAVTALRIRHQAGSSWTVAEGELLATGGERVYRYDLQAHTLASLAGALTADGFTVTPPPAALATKSALVLVEGRGAETASNGDQLPAFRSPLWLIYSGYAQELRLLRQQIAQAIRQMVIPQSEGGWADLWGRLYNVPRKQGEADGTYAARIPDEAFRVRVNAFALEQAIRDETGLDVRIEEPWNNIFRLDESKLSGTSRFYDGGTVGYHLIRPVSFAPLHWAPVLEIIQRNKAAGVLVLPPQEYSRVNLRDGIDGTIWAPQLASHAVKLIAWRFNRLDSMRLSAEELVLDHFAASQVYPVDCLGGLSPVAYPVTRTLAHSTWLTVAPLVTAISRGAVQSRGVYASLPRPGWRGRWSREQTWMARYGQAVYSRSTQLTS